MFQEQINKNQKMHQNNHDLLSLINKKLIKQNMLQRTILFTILVALLLPFSVLNWCKDTTFKTGKAINAMVVSPSGRYLAVAHNDNFVRFYHGSNYIKVGQYNVGYTINVMRFSNDGYYLAIGGASNSLTILNAYEPFTLNRTMAPIHTLTATNVVGLDFSNDSTKFIACGAASSGGGRLSMYTVNPLLAWAPTTVSPLNMNPAANAAIDCRISPFNGHVAVVIASKIIVYDSTLTTTIGTTTASTSFSKVVFDPLATQLVYINLATQRLMNWVIGGGAPTQLSGPSTALADNDFMFNGKYIAAGGSAKILYIYNGSRVSYERWKTTDVIKGVVFTRDAINPKLYTGDNSGQVLVLTMNCMSGCPPSYYYTGTSCSFCGDAIDKCIDCFNGTICDKCVDGYFVDPYTNQCQSCPLFGCLVCTSAATCSECHSGFYLDSTTLTCKRCSSAATLQGCAVCSSSTVCLACNNDYWLSGSVCKNCSTMSNCLKCTNGTKCTECVMGYYQNSGTCTPCNANCLSCTNTATNCSQCAKGWYANTPTSFTCQRCSTGCLTCNNSNFCFQCQNGMYQKTDGTCATCVFPCINCQDASICYACSQGYYLLGTTCLPCTSNCATCNSTAYCSSCLAGYFFSGGSCTSCSPTYPDCEYCSSTVCQSCQPGYFLNSSTLCQHCSLVMFKCQKCTSLSNCLSCVEGFNLTGANAGNLSCKSCPTGCQTCKDNSLCRKCYKNYYLDSATNTCQPCTGNCLQCTDSSTCSVCDSGYYLDMSVCKLCSFNITNCLQCLNASVCINCQVGYYLDSTDNKCYRCASNCVTCNFSQCFSCEIGYFLSTVTPITCQVCSQSCTECTSLMTCTSCKAGFYIDSSSKSCKNCSHNRFCSTCNNLTCYSCHYGYYLDNTIASPNYNCTQCVSKMQGCLHCNASNYCLGCDLGYYMDGSNICKTCTVINGCERCSDQNTCVACGQGFYLNGSAKCQVCKPGCSSCNPSGDCFTCYPGYYKSGTNCLICKTNLEGCELCSSSLTCLQCMNGYFLSTLTTQCELCRSSIVGCLYCNDSLTCTNCQPGFYLDTVNDICHTCDKNMAGCEICSSSSICLDCEVGYYLTSGGGSGCTLCSSSLSGCLSCTDINTCELCKTGFYLGTDNKCHTCFSSNSGCQACAAITGGIECQKCSSGFYLNSVTKLCAPCQTMGCKLCAELNPSDCLTCNSLYYLTGTSCIKCSTPIPGCSQCLDNTNCLICDVGYYLDSNNKCQLCQDILNGCSKCNKVGSSFECEDCKSSYILDSVTKTCKTCFSVLQGCTYCINQTECISCANGYFKDSSTDLCRSCTEQPGCLLCSNEMACEYCSPSYFLDQTSQKCIKCSTVIPFCLTCLESQRCLSCQSGYYVNDKFQCQQVTVTATQKVNGVKLITEYVNSQTLGHTLFVKNDKYQNIGYNLTGQCELFLTDYNQLTATKKIVQVQLKIKDIKWIGPNQIKFLTDNPTSLTKDSMLSLAQSAQTIQKLELQSNIQKQQTPRLLTATGVGNFKVSLEMSQQAVNTILPNIYQTGNLILDYSLSDPQFYISYLKYQGSSAASYSIFGYAVTVVLLLNFIYKTYKMTARSQQKHHYTGEIISHILALKSISLFHYPITYELYYFCYGFMLVDLPWLNYEIGPLLGQRSDYVPTQLVMYFYNLNLASTYLLSLILSVVLLSLRFVINKKNEFARTKYTKLIYSIFMFGMIYAGSLSLQGAIYNPIQNVSVNGLFYILGILGYIIVFIQMVYSINKNKNELYKVRIFIKASLLSIGHLNPIIVVSVAIITDVLLIVLQYVILQTNVAWNKFWLANHLLLDLSLALMFLLPNSAISLYSTFSIIIIVVIVEIALNLKLMSYMESKYPKSNNLSDIVNSHRKRQKNQNQGFFGKNDSLQTFMEQKQFGKLNMWNNQGQFNSLHDIAIQDERVDMTKKQFYESRDTKFSSFFDFKNLNKNEIQEQQGNKKRGRRVPRQSKEANENKRMSNLFRVQNSSSSSPTQESVNSNQDKDKKKVQPNFIRTSNNIPPRDKKRTIPFQ